MRALIQRVKRAKVKVDQKTVSQIKKGYLVFLAVGHNDQEKQAILLAKKVANLRIMADKNQKMNYSLKDVGGQALVVSQFTLLADCRRGNRPSFIKAAPPAKAKKLYQLFMAQLKEEKIKVKAGVFQAFMDVELVNQGPVTIMIDI